VQNIYLSEAVTIKDYDIKQVLVERNGVQRKVLQLEGLFQRAGEPNRNNRIYTEKVLRREADKLQNTKIRNEGGLIGEMEHPVLEGNDNSALNRALRISYERACIMIQDLRMTGSDIIGKCEILHDANQLGSTVAAMVERGHYPGVSSRAVGSKPVMNEKGHLIVNEDINFITWDVVSDPSVHNARLHAFINEEIERYEYEQKNTYKRSLWNVLENIGK
jgi:hypothetical protein